MDVLVCSDRELCICATYARRTLSQGKLLRALLYDLTDITTFKRDFFGIVLAVIGAVTVVLSANTSDTRLDHDALVLAISQHVFIAYSITYAVGAIILSILSESNVGRRHVFVDVGLCALFGTCTAMMLATSSLIFLIIQAGLPCYLRKPSPLCSLRNGLRFSLTGSHTLQLP